MLTIGVDAQKRVPMAVAVDDAGREVASWRDPTAPAAGGGGGGWGAACRWGIAGAWNDGKTRREAVRARTRCIAWAL